MAANPLLATFTGAGASPTTPKIRTPKMEAQSNVASFTMHWNRRIPQFVRTKGINFKTHVMPVFNYDLQRVKQGKRPFTDVQVMDFVGSLKAGHPLVQKQSGGGGILGGIEHFVGNVGKDLGGIAQGLNPVTLVPAIGKQIETVATHPEVLTRFLSAPNFDEAMKELGTTPLLDLIPGVYTATHALRGDFSTLLDHPISTLLDVTPYFVGAGRIFAAAKIADAADEVGLARKASLDPTVQAAESGVAKAKGELAPGVTSSMNLSKAQKALDAAKAAWNDAHGSLIPKNTPLQALADGNPYKALGRSLGITGEGNPTTKLATQLYTSTPAGLASPTTRLAQKAGISRDLRDIARKHAEVQAAQRTLEGAKHKVIDVQVRIAKGESGPKIKAELELANKRADAAGFNADMLNPSVVVNYAAAQSGKSALDVLQEAKDLGLAKTDKEALKYLRENYTKLSVFARWMKAKWPKEERVIPGSTAGSMRMVKTDMVIPNHIAQPMKKLIDTGDRELLGKLGGNAVQLFKYAVLTGPRHSAHVLFSNAMFMAMDQLSYFKPVNIKGAWDMAHHPENYLIPEMPHGVGTFERKASDIGVETTDYQTLSEKANLAQAERERLRNKVTGAETRVQQAQAELHPTVTTSMGLGKAQKQLAKAQEQYKQFETEQVQGIAEGKTLGRWYKSVKSHAEQAAHSQAGMTVAAPINPVWYRHMEELMTDMSRGMVYMQKHGEALKAGATELGAREAGLGAVNRVLLDFQGMAPVERTILKQVLPFYPFTRQLFSYLAQYPINHPVKAAILAAVGRQEMQDWGTGIPQKFMSLFGVGGMKADGSQLMIDTKPMNPFRSLNGLSPFTMAGFLSELNPVITAPFEAGGFHILTATPELYPQLTVDPISGDLVSTHPNAASTIIGQFIPEYNTVASVLGLSNNLKSLQQADPQAYRRLLFSMLNIPFVPTSFNMTRQRLRYAKNIFSIAQSDTSAAAKAGTLAQSPYTEVPYQGNLYNPQQLAQLIKAAG